MIREGSHVWPRSCRKPIIISYVLVISVYIAEILQRTNITVVHITFPSIFSASNVHNNL